MKDQGVDLTFMKSKTRRGRKMEFKSNCLTASKFEYCWFDGKDVRLLTPVECERLQTLPDNYTTGVCNRQRYKALGNGWTVDVIAHFFKNIPEKRIKNVVSLFDGISCGQVALERAGIRYKNYYAAEINKYAIQVAKNNYPNTIHIGDVTQVDWKTLF